MASVTQTREAIQDAILTECGQSVYAKWLDDTQSDRAGHDDPEIVLDPITWAIAGRIVYFNKDAIQRYTPLSKTSQTATGDLPIQDLGDAWMMRPLYPGDYNFTISENGFSKSTTIRVVAPLDLATAPVRYLLVDGDSNVVRMGRGALPFLKRYFGDRLVFVGTQVQLGFEDTPTEGHDSYSFGTFNNSGVPGPSPYYFAGVLNMPSYSALLSHVPDFWWKSALANDIYQNSNDSTIDTVITAAFGNLDPVIAAGMAAWPSLRRTIVFSPTCVAAGDPATAGEPGNSESARLQQHRLFSRGAARVVSTYAGRGAEKLDALTIQTRFNTRRGNEDLIHVNNCPMGHGLLFEALAACLVGNWNAS